jgi:hypothetical protein
MYRMPSGMQSSVETVCPNHFACRQSLSRYIGICGHNESGSIPDGMLRNVAKYFSTKLKSLRDSILCNYATKLVIGSNAKNLSNKTFIMLNLLLINIFII